MRLLLSFLLICIFALKIGSAQPYQQKDASEIKLALNKLNVLGSALYIAAHPDDENQAVLSWLESGELVRAGYLAITRGDGGQNLLGTENGALLGVLRTQELLAARRIDGAEQFFTRAIDFGYSKSPDETMKFWGHDKILADVVWVIRNFQPDIIITRFSENQGGHGHHLASARLAKEAFFASADPTQFPEQLQYVKPWQVKRVLWNTWRPDLENRDPKLPPIITVDLGDYNPLTGKSYAELAAESRTMHKTQGFGSSPRRGSYINYFEHIVGEPAITGLFDGIDLSWHRVPNGDKVKTKIEAIIKSFDAENPGKSVSGLVELMKLLDTFPDNDLVSRKKDEVRDLIRQCAGLWIEANAENPSVSPGDTIKTTFDAINRSDSPIQLRGIKIDYMEQELPINKPLNQNELLEQNFTLQIPERAEFSQPYWLKEKAEFGRYNVDDQTMIGKPQNDPAISATFEVSILGREFEYLVPVQYYWNDATKGEQYRPFSIQPEVSLKSNEQVLIFENEHPKHYGLTINSEKSGIGGTISLKLPVGWKAEPDQFNFKFEGDQKSASFESQIYPPKDESTGALTASVLINGRTYNSTIENIDYDHIPAQTVLVPVETHLVRLNLQKLDESIGYIMGAGDEIPEALQQVGYSVELISINDLGSKDLSQYDVIICGVRAYNTLPELQEKQSVLNAFVKNGGTWIVQHNTRFGYRTEHIGPVPFTIGRDRISDEAAELKPINPEDPLLNFPNRINQHDFDNWVQERGLYFASDWDTQFTPVLIGSDPGESPKEGSLIYTRYGAGIFIYSGLSFFRQLPAGVPGAYRLFVNLISAGQPHAN